jgi:hypothetical protein
MTSVVTIKSNQVAAVGSGTAASKLNVVVGNNDTVTAGDYVSMTAGNHNTITIGDYGILVSGNRTDTSVGDDNLLMVGNNDIITAGDNDTIFAGNNNTISMGTGLLSLGNNSSVTLIAGAALTINHLGNGNVLHDGSAIVNGKLVSGGNTISFGDCEKATLYGTGDTLNVGRGSVITIGGDGGADPTRSSFTIGNSTTGATINGGLGIDTFSPGTGYLGGNHYVGSAHGFDDGFATIGSCINYTGTADAAGKPVRVVVDDNAGVGYGYDSSGTRLWTDTFTNIQQVKASAANGNELTASNAFYCEMKGAGGSVTFHGGAAGDRIMWSSADKTGVAGAGQGVDIAYAGTGTDEFYWRNQPKAKGLSNMGETIYNFSVALDDLNFSEFTTVGSPFVNASGRNFSTAIGSDGLVDDLFNWVSVSLDGNGNTDVLFDKFGDGTTNGQHFQTAVVLKGLDLFGAYGVQSTSPGASQQVIEDLYSFNGHSALVLNQTH